MTAPFPNTPTFTGYDAPSRIEGDVYDLEILGDLPAGLDGAFYRVGPDPQYPPRLGDDIYISGDGMVSMFRFENGHVDFRQRYVRTARFLAERKARRSLFGAYRNAYTDDPAVARVSRGVANTTPVWHGGRLLILKEDSLPYELDPVTLATRGVFDWGGRLKTRTVTAHPKIDPETGELLFYGYEASGDGSTDMAFCVADASGELVREEWFKAPYAAMVHDFAITRDHVIFPIFPAVVDMNRVKAGGPHWMTDNRLQAYIGIMPRRGGVKDIRWFPREACHAFHMINAWSEGDTVHLDLSVAQACPFPYIPDVSGAPYDPRASAPIPTRWTFDLSRNDDQFEERVIGAFSGDVPRIDDRRAGLPYRYAYMGMVDPTRPMQKSGPVGAGFNQVGQIDLEAGTTNVWYGADTDTFQEPQFIPTGPEEDDGYVVAVIDRHGENRSDVGVFDARAFARGPVAIIRLPLRLRGAFHGTWIPGAELPVTDWSV